MLLKMNKISIKWKLFLFLTVFVFFIIALLWIFQVVFLDDFYKSIKTSDIKSYAQKLKGNINSDILGDLVAKTAIDGDVSVIIAKENGEIRASAEGKAGSLIFRMPQSQFYHYLQLAKENGGEYMELFEGFGSLPLNDSRIGGKLITRAAEQAPQTIIYVVTAEASDKSIYVILLNTNITPIDSTVQTIRWQLSFITVILLLLALLLALLISRQISGPIMSINKTSKELAKGNYDVAFGESGYKEISELAQSLNYAATELSKVDRLKTELIANISHDLRTPLTLITGYSEAMRDLPNENNEENIQIIIDEAKRLSSLVTDMLDISKLQSGAAALNITQFNLTKNVHEIVSRFSKLTGMDGYSIDFKSDCEVIVSADEIKLSQVIYNLVNNAITHTGIDKTVTIIQRVFSGTVRIEITDTGEGIEADKLSQIWERYYKLDKEHKRSVTGTGLGLSIVKTIFDLHNLHYGVTSKLSNGSTFWFVVKIDDLILNS